jgi:hypothetical protein
MEHRLARVGSHLQVAAKTRGRPGRVAGIAGHAAVGMSQRRIIIGDLSRYHAVFVQQFGSKRFLAEVRVARGDGIERLNDLPLCVFPGHGALIKSVTSPFESAQTPRRAQPVEMAPPLATRRD